MFRIAFTGFALIVAAACTTPNTPERSDFAVIRGGVDIDALALQCANDPASAGFSTSQECFQHAKELMDAG